MCTYAFCFVQPNVNISLFYHSLSNLIGQQEVNIERIHLKMTKLRPDFVTYSPPSYLFWNFRMTSWLSDVIKMASLFFDNTAILSFLEENVCYTLYLVS